MGRQDSRTPNASPPPYVAGLLVRTAPSLCGSSSAHQTPKAPHHTRFAGRFLPTRVLSRLRDDGTTRQPPPKHLAAPTHFAGRLSRTHLKNTSQHHPHVAGRSHTLRVGFYLPERFRELGTTRRRDSRTPKHSLSHCGSLPHAAPPQNTSPPTLRVVSLFEE